MLGLDLIKGMNIDLMNIENLDRMYGDKDFNDMNLNIRYIDKICDFTGVPFNDELINFILAASVFGKNPMMAKTVYKLISYPLYNIDIELNRKKTVMDIINDISYGNMLNIGLEIDGMKKPENMSLMEEYIWSFCNYVELLGRSWGYYELSYIYGDGWKNKFVHNRILIAYNIVYKGKLYTVRRSKDSNQIYITNESEKETNDIYFGSYSDIDTDFNIDKDYKVFDFKAADDIVDLCSDDTIIIGKLGDFLL